MKPSTEYTEYVLELLAPIGQIHTTQFFGGVGVYYGSVQFAMMIGNTLYFVTDENTRTKYEQAGKQPFSYMTKKGHVLVRRYYELPEEVLTEAGQLRVWANESIAIAARTQKPKQKNKKISHAT